VPGLKFVPGSSKRAQGNLSQNWKAAATGGWPRGEMGVSPYIAITKTVRWERGGGCGAEAGRRRSLGARGFSTADSCDLVSDAGAGCDRLPWPGLSLSLFPQLGDEEEEEEEEDALPGGFSLRSREG